MLTIDETGLGQGGSYLAKCSGEVLEPDAGMRITIAVPITRQLIMMASRFCLRQLPCRQKHHLKNHRRKKEKKSAKKESLE
jgi:hypothetical protein